MGCTLGDEPLRQQYSELIGHQTALNQALEQLRQREVQLGVEPEFHRHQKDLIQAKLSHLQTEIEQLQSDHPDLKLLAAEQLRAELVAIEVNTYAQLVRAGRLRKELPPLLPKILETDEQ